jgi:uncharacterized RDD family membrane protein YckC
MTAVPPLDPELADLLAGYRHVLRFADERLLAGRVAVGEGRWLRHVRVLVTTAFLRPIVAAHAARRVAELERAVHYEAATSGADRAAALDCLEHFRQSLPVVPLRRYTVWFLGAVLVCALVVSNLMRALAPAELDQASRAMGDLAGAVVTVDTSGLVDGVQKFTVGSAIAAAVLITFSLYFVALVPLGSFRLKRILFNHHPATRADVEAAVAGHERRCATGLYECEARVFAAHGLPAPCERPADLAASATLAAFPLLLGVAALVSQEPRHAIGKADSDLVNFVLVPVAQFVLLVLPLAAFYRLSDVRLDRTARRADIRVFARSELADVGRRFAALTLDWLLAWLLVVVLVAIVVATVGENAPAGFFYFAVMPLAYAIATVPFVLRPGPRRGQSLGKQLLRIRVVDAEGDRLRTSQILVREVLVKSLVLFGIAFLLAYLPLLVDLVMTLRDPQRRSIEDRVATTRVVRASVPARAAAPEPERVLVAA